MNVRRGGLGRGLGALIPAGPIEDAPSGARFEEIPVLSIEPNPKQPREVFDEDALAELVTSIREVGVLQPVVVREVDPGRYQLIMGERRWRASREAGLDLVPAIVRETSDDHLLRDALLENLHRQQLNPLEEAAAYQQLLHEFGATHDELAERIGRSRSQVSNTIRLLGLPPAVQRRVAAGVLSAGHARALLALSDPAGQERLATRIVAEGMSVRATEEAAASDQGEPSGSQGRSQGRPPQPSSLRSLADALSDRLETRVLAELGRRRGKLTVEFASLPDLRRVVSILAPDLGHIVSQEESDSVSGPSDAPTGDRSAASAQPGPSEDGDGSHDSAQSDTASPDTGHDLAPDTAHDLAQQGSAQQGSAAPEAAVEPAGTEVAGDALPAGAGDGTERVGLPVDSVSYSGHSAG